MRTLLILDTHVLVWFIVQDKRLGLKTREVISLGMSNKEIAISAATIFEISWLMSRNRIKLGRTSEAFLSDINELGIATIDINGAQAFAASKVSLIQGDPMDRLIVAATLLNHATLVTADDTILNAKLPCRILNARL